MGNTLDETKGPFNDEGREARVIDKQIPVKIGFLSILFEIFIWAIGFVVALLIILAGGDNINGIAVVVLLLCGFLPGIIYTIAKIHAKNYFMQLEQKIQTAASDLGNYQDKRYRILVDVVDLLKRSTGLDENVMKAVAAYRSGMVTGDGLSRNAEALSRGFSYLVPHVEAYPELKSQAVIAEAIRQDHSLQADVTAARGHYNDCVYQWNRDIFIWPVYQIVAARQGYTTRIPFIASAEVIEGSKKAFFKLDE